MRHTRSHTANRRSHHALGEPRLSACKDCGAMHLKHHVCVNCGKYRGIQVLDVEAKSARKETRKKEKNKALGIEPSSSSPKTKEKKTDKKEKN